MLAVVEDEQRVTTGERRHQPGIVPVPPLLGNADGFGNRRGDHRRISDPHQVDEHRTVAAGGGGRPGNGQGQSGLPDAAGTGHGDHPMIGELSCQRRLLGDPPDEWRH